MTRFLFLATIFCVTFEKVHWNIAGTVSLADILAIAFLVMWTLERLARRDRRLARTSAVVTCFGLAFLLVYLVGYYAIDTGDGTGQFGKGIFKWAIHILFLVAGVTYLARRGERFYWQTIGVVHRRAASSTPPTACSSSSPRRAGATSTSAVLSPLTGGASSINIYGAVEGQERLPAERAHRRPEPPRDHAHRPAARSAAGLPAASARPPAATRSSRSCSPSC